MHKGLNIDAVKPIPAMTGENKNVKDTIRENK